MKVSALKCPVCEAVIWSQKRHDCRFCDCKKCHIDGGRAYTKVGWEPGLSPTIGVYDTDTKQFSTDDEEDLYQ
jgi:hypothetical protein